MNEELMMEGARTPSVWLELRGSQTKQLEEVEAGVGVKIVLRGKVVSVTERDVDGRYTGELEVAYSRMRVIPESNEFGELVEDDDD